MTGKKTTMYKQGNGWIVSSWDDSVKCFRDSGEKSYWEARNWVGEDNCPHKSDGKCQVASHQHS